MKQFVCRTVIRSGPDALDSLAGWGIQRLLVVTDPYFYENGTAGKTAARFRATQTDYFTQVAPDPSIQLVAQGLARMQSLDPDTVVALGGGSAIDCAKAMVYLHSKKVHLIAVPTTSGSGAEVTDLAIITAKGTKQVLQDPAMQPETAILDGSFLEDLPQSLIAAGGFDAMHHALEALAATGAGAVTDALAADSFCTVFSLLERSFSGDKAVRLRIHRAATMAAVAFQNAGLGLGHAAAHALGGCCHLPHGQLGAMLLPHLLDCNAPAAGEKYAALAERLGLGGATTALGVRNLKNALIKLRSRVQLPETLQQAGLLPETLDGHREALLSHLLADPCCKTNPVPVTRELAQQFLEKTAHG